LDEQARLNQEFGEYLHRTVALLDRVADRALQQSVGISLSQFLVLLSTDADAKLSLSQQNIADHLGINKAAVSRHIDALVAQGWVERAPHPTSGRQVVLRITDEGLLLLRRAQKIMQATMSPHYRAGGDLERMLDNLKAIHASLLATAQT